MSLEVLAKAEDWSLFNSSLLIEVTRPSGIFTCTGVVVGTQTVLTAAHCLEGEVTKVRIFTQEIYDPEYPCLEVKGYKLHPDYDRSISRYRSDIAKIILKENIPSDINIYPILEGNRFEGTILRFGFGARGDRNIRTAVTPQLRRLNVEESVLELNDRYSRSGDSGGPIFLKKGKKISLLAIHSTFSFGPEGEYSLNPRLGSYLSWIFEN